eukprot:458422-Pyramimonas_sp.AAC.1
MAEHRPAEDQCSASLESPSSSRAAYHSSAASTTNPNQILAVKENVPIYFPIQSCDQLDRGCDLQR